MVSHVQLERAYREVEAELHAAGNRGQRFENGSDPAVKFLSDAFGGATYTWDEYKDGLVRAKHDLVVAQRAISNNDRGEAEVYLLNARRYVDQCGRLLGRYYKETANGAEIGRDASIAMLIGAATSGIGGVASLFFNVGKGAVTSFELSMVVNSATVAMMAEYTDANGSIYMEHPVREDVSKIFKLTSDLEAPPKEIELIQHAQQELLRWSRDEDSLPSASIGNFLIDMEMSWDGEKRKVLLDSWDDTVARYRQDISHKRMEGMDGIKKVAGLLYNDYLSFYSRDNRTLSGLISGGWGNCDARTRAVVSMISALKIGLPDGQRLGVQIFANHVQPVIYDENNDSYFDIVSNKNSKFDESSAPIYDAHIIYSAYLKRTGADSPVKYDDLLIRPADANLAPETDGQGDSIPGKGEYGKIDYPSSKIIYDGEVPLFNFNRTPYEAAGRPAVATRVSSGVGFEENDIVSLENIDHSVSVFGNKFSMKELIDERMKDLGHRVSVIWTNHLLTDEECYKDPDACTMLKKVIFRDEETLNGYLCADSQASKEAYVATLIKKDISDHLASPLYEKYLNVLKNPEVILKMSEEEVVELSRFIHDTHEMVYENARNIMGRLFLGDRDIGKKEEELQALITSAPLYDHIKKVLEKFGDDVRNDGGRYVSMLGDMNYVQRDLFFALLLRSSVFLLDFDTLYQSLDKAFADKDRFEVEYPSDKKEEVVFEFTVKLTRPPNDINRPRNDERKPDKRKRLIKADAAFHILYELFNRVDYRTMLSITRLDERMSSYLQDVVKKDSSLYEGGVYRWMVLDLKRGFNGIGDIKEPVIPEVLRSFDKMVFDVSQEDAKHLYENGFAHMSPGRVEEYPYNCSDWCMMAFDHFYRDNDTFVPWVNMKNVINGGLTLISP